MKTKHLLRIHLITLFALAWISQARGQEGGATYTLSITEAEHGTVTVSPDMANYPEGTVVTLTAIPEQGYRFIRWGFGEGYGAQGQQGRLYTDNPHTFLFQEVPFVIESETKVAAIFGREISPAVHYDNLGVLGPDPTGSGSALKSTFDRDPAYPNYPISIAQRFRAGSAGNVTSVEVGLARLGNPGGHLIFSVREVDEATGNPDEIVGNLGELEGDSVPQIDWCWLPLLLETVHVEGFVGGLEPGRDYFLHVVQAEDDLPRNGWNQLCDASSTSLVIDLVDYGSQGVFGEALITSFDWPYVPDDLLPGQWSPWGVNLNLTMRFRIEGTLPTAPELKIERAVQISWPESGSAGVLERASSPDGPWEAVTETMQTVDGENRVTILTNPDNAYFRLHEE